jgi:tRNA A-37 threonylcarbamoyl transferase component Bud32
LDKRYELYCLADRLFYDSPAAARQSDSEGEGRRFRLARDPVPEGWTRYERSDWLVYQPAGMNLPAQGWKIHASATLDSATDVLARVWEYCIPRRIAFKFIAGPRLLFLRNLKYAHRGSSGKFVTIYPADEAQLESVLTELGAAVDGLAGPYILSDLRWGDGPLYVRYGGFAERWCVGANGEQQLAIADGDGRLVPDRRGPTFQVPPWVTLPVCLEPHLAARNATTLAGLPYRIERPLHFSNGGGLYAAVDERSGDAVVLKEARPHAALSIDGADAVARLRHERDVLTQLAGLDTVPALRDYFTVGGHEFLVEDFVEGATLNSELVRRWPLFARRPDAETTAAYAEWALGICAEVERAVDAVHARGLAIGDLHPNNIMVRPEGGVALIDLEVATQHAEQGRPTIADPGFTPPAGLRGAAVDRYALACLRLHLFLPLTTLLVLDAAKAQEIATAITDVFEVPEAFVAEAVRVIASATAAAGSSGPRPAAAPVPDPEDWWRVRASLASAIIAAATPERDDRLFPGDIQQFTSGGLNLAHGAAGVLYALHVVGAGRYPKHEKWLLERALRSDAGGRVGFYDGLHGVAHALECLDRRDDALAVLERCMDAGWERLGLDLASGLAGVGLNLAHFAQATGDRSLWEATYQVADAVAGRLGGEDDVPEVSGGRNPYAGLLRGASGPGLMFLRLYEHDEDSRWLDLAATALRQDLRRCIVTEHGTLNVDEGWRTMPYLADGSVGIGMVLDEYLAQRDDERFADASARIRGAAEGAYYGQSGLFAGRAGMILYLSRRHPPGRAVTDDDVVATHIRRIGWHALHYKGHLAFPGDQLLRLSMDLATGSAGVLLALGAAMHARPVGLPFLGAQRPARPENLDLAAVA